jgi:hypothetical protein
MYNAVNATVAKMKPFASQLALDFRFRYKYRFGIILYKTKQLHANFENFLVFVPVIVCKKKGNVQDVRFFKTIIFLLSFSVYQYTSCP